MDDQQMWLKDVRSIPSLLLFIWILKVSVGRRKENFIGSIILRADLNGKVLLRFMKLFVVLSLYELRKNYLTEISFKASFMWQICFRLGVLQKEIRDRQMGLIPEKSFSISKWLHFLVLNQRHDAWFYLP